MSPQQPDPGGPAGREHGLQPLATVFGGSGMLGTRMVEALKHSGYRVRIATRHPAQAGTADVEAMAADVRDPRAVADACAGAHAVCNAVALYVERGEDTFDAVHVQGAGNVAAEAAAAGASRLVHVSGIGTTADSPSRYVRARAAGERVVREKFPRVTILRPSVMLGGEHDLLHTLDALTRLPVVALFGAGNTRLQPVHADDVARAAVRVIGDEATAGRVYELGGKEVVTWRGIVEAVLHQRRRRPALVPVPFALWDLLATVLGHMPAAPLTRDQVELMRHDNVVAAGADGFAELGIEPRGLQEVLATYRGPGGAG